MNSEQADLKARFSAPPDRDLPPGRQACRAKRSVAKSSCTSSTSWAAASVGGIMAKAAARRGSRSVSL